MNFGLQIAQFEPNLRVLALHLTNNAAESEDLIQDTYYRALRNSEKFSEGTNIKAWLYTIMRNIFINNYRRNKRTQTVSAESNDRVFSSKGGVEQNASYRTFLSQEINHALTHVSADFTEPFLMYFRGYQYQEIANHLSIPIGTVKSRIFFARKELQNRLKHVGIENSAYLN